VEPETGVMTHRSPAGERVWRAACELFYLEGIRSVGIAEIAARSGVGKPNLYRNFASKEGLAMAYLAAQVESQQELLDRARAAHPDDPTAQLRTVVAESAQRICSPGYRGCALANAAIEFPEPEHPVLVAVAAAKAQRLADLAELTEKIGVADPEALAYMIQLLLDGAAASAQMLPAQRAADALIEAVNRLIDSCQGN
jgi:AcrR family transcriptional regulator